MYDAGRLVHDACVGAPGSVNLFSAVFWGTPNTHSERIISSSLHLVTCSLAAREISFVLHVGEIKQKAIRSWAAVTQQKASRAESE